MKDQTIYPIILTILDGWGYSTNKHGNAIQLAKTPTIDSLWNKYPKTLLNASGEDVGLPPAQMGNSEVGHMTIGAGRTIDQDLVRINQSINTNNFFQNQILHHIYQTTHDKSKKLHLIGLCSDGGVHSHIDHLQALIKFSKKYINLKICIHVITDGRDTKPQEAIRYINDIENNIREIENINICTVSGRYYSMDRDCRWNRIEKAYTTLTKDTIDERYLNNPIQVINDSYKKGIYDEFIIPTRTKQGKIEDNDSIIFFNFRPDRIRQLLQSFAKTQFKGFRKKNIPHLNIATFTVHDSTLDIPIVFPEPQKHKFLGEIISEQGFKQFRLAETEKYAHVTYFFNGGIEEPFIGEDRELIPSPPVDVYDSTPEMSAEQITRSIIQAIDKDIYQLLIINYANPDMIGHTGNLNATVQAIETVDHCINSLLKKAQEVNATLIITADHGNAEKMLDNNNKPCKSHTTNPVPFIIVQNEDLNSINHKHVKYLRSTGSLTDIAPTILDLLDISIPQEMNGQSLLKPKVKQTKERVETHVTYA